MFQIIAAHTDWMDHGACRDEDPDLHFPIGETSKADRRQITEAKQVCATCPVLEQCREFGMDEPHGIWGGLSEQERREMRSATSRHRSLTVIDGDAEPSTPGARPSIREARRLFAQVLADIESTGTATVAQADVPRSFLAQVRSKTWVNRELNRLADLGVLEKTTDGSYRFVVPVTEAVAA